jgi:hypothetical protein
MGGLVPMLMGFAWASDRKSIDRSLVPELTALLVSADQEIMGGRIPMHTAALRLEVLVSSSV